MKEEMTIEADTERDQREYYLGDSCTKEEFHEVYGKLMATTWEVVPYGRKDPVKVDLLERGWSFGYHNQLGALGTCYRRSKTIKISQRLLLPNLATSAKDFEDTIRHEIAHAINAELGEPKGHGTQWTHYAHQLNFTPSTGCKVLNEPKEKWTLACENCGRSYKRYRLSKRTREGVSCAGCCKKYNNGRWTEKFKLKITKNY